MKKFIGVIAAIAALILCLTLSACGDKYVSKYSAERMVKTHTSEKASLSFNGFRGTYVIKLRHRGDEVAFISYEASLDEGTINVYYDFNDEKLNLFEIETNGTSQGKTNTFSGDRTIYVIIEADKKCNGGSFSFVLEEGDPYKNFTASQIAAQPIDVYEEGIFESAYKFTCNKKAALIKDYAEYCEYAFNLGYTEAYFENNSLLLFMATSTSSYNMQFDKIMINEGKLYPLYIHDGLDSVQGAVTCDVIILAYRAEIAKTDNYELGEIIYKYR